MNPSTLQEYTGTPGRRAESAHPDAPQQPEPYVASPALVRAVNLAIYLRRPLLLEGEAGCGKTRLARAVAYELGLPYYAWPVRSTSRAQEGLYTYDAVLRLHDVHVARLAPPARRAAGPPGPARPPRRGGRPPAAGEPGRTRDPRNPKDYRHFGALGRAFDLRGCPAVVLIDEIDKADLDFPNDLLTVLDTPWQFDVPETEETVAADPENPPIVFITSNKEKGNLPAPFLRRCVYFYVDFPDDAERLKAIVEAHYGAEKMPPADLFRGAAERFLEVRKAELFKRPGTSEFLDWLEALRGFRGGYPPAKLSGEKDSLPYPELLFKLWDDYRRFRKVS